MPQMYYNMRHSFKSSNYSQLLIVCLLKIIMKYHISKLTVPASASVAALSNQLAPLQDVDYLRCFD